MEDKQISPNKLKKKSLLSIVIIMFLVGNIGFYFQERAKWIHKGQPYPEAKEWLVPANMMLVYGTTITKLPFIDERSFIMKPIIALQDYFVSKWQEKLPDDDAEKYLDWYIFRLRTHIEPNGGGIILYGSKKYTFDEVIQFNEKSWETISAMVKYDAKDKEFNEIRYAAFNNLSALFVSNFTTYWIHNPVPYNPDYIDQSILENRYKSSKSYVDLKSMLADEEKHERLFKLYGWIAKMDNLYALAYPDIYTKSQKAEAADYWINSRMHKTTKYILFYLSQVEYYKNFINFCTIDENVYLVDYIKSKQWLLENEEFLKTKNISIKKTVSKETDEQIEKICPNLNIQ